MSNPDKYRPVRCSLPVEVWDRLAAEAERDGIKIGTLLSRLVIARDEKIQARQNQG